MRIQFSDHALERIRSRKLTTDQIKEAIENPDEQEPTPTNQSESK